MFRFECIILFCSYDTVLRYRFNQHAITLFNCVINVNQHLNFYLAYTSSNMCKFDEFRRIMKEFYDIFQDIGILDLRRPTAEPFHSDCGTFYF